MQIRLADSQENIAEVLSLRPMPAGVFTTAHTPADEGQPETITMINTVLFAGVFRIVGSNAPVQCYGVQDPIDHAIIWYSSDQVPLYAYGPYVATCELIGQEPQSFIEWYSERKKGNSEFNLPLKVRTERSYAKVRPFGS